ncbi:MAG: hypothetical protein HC802_20805 [Caldilineaceae bacterium]|nr:hypothetical protein [Caldilineaceae bacterium]
MLYSDANGNSAYDDGEGLTSSHQISLLNADGDVVASAENGEAGALFQDLVGGQYTLAIDGAPVNTANITISTDEGEVEGKVLYVVPDSE